MDNAKAAILIIIILLCDFNFLLFVNANNKPKTCNSIPPIITTENQKEISQLKRDFMENIPMSEENQAPFPPAYPTGGWYIDREGQVNDTNVYRNSTASIRLDATSPSGDNPARECNSIWINAGSGDRVIFTCYIKITDSTLGDYVEWAGARIGLDFYANEGRVSAVQSDGQHGYYPNESEQAKADHYVNWNEGGGTWIARTIDFTIPSQMMSDGGSYGGESLPQGEYYTIVGVIASVQVWGSYGSTDGGQAWFADPEIYVNPVTPDQTPIAVLVATSSLLRR